MKEWNILPKLRSNYGHGIIFQMFNKVFYLKKSINVFLREIDAKSFCYLKENLFIKIICIRVLNNYLNVCCIH